LKGGAAGEKVIPMYQEKINPTQPMEYQEIEKQRMTENYQKLEKQKLQEKQLINLQVYQPAKPKQDKFPEGVSYQPAYSANPYFPAQMANSMNPFSMSMLGMTYPMSVNINKVYEINASGPVAPHNKLNMIYEDILPGKGFTNTFKTVGERTGQLQFVRTVLFNEGDGSEVNLDGSSANSLLSRMKFLDLNPYNTNKFSNNPYKGLPEGFLLYRTCYPIKRSEPFGHATCAKDSMAVNVRIYKLTAGSYLLNKQNNVKMNQFNQWREITYYEHIREYVIKKKVCPNFVTLFGYYLCRRSNINFDKIKTVNLKQLQNVSLQTMQQQLDDLNIHDKQHTQMNDALIQTLRNINPGNMIQNLSTELALKNIQSTQTKVDLNAYCGEVLVALTESPTYNIFSWASKVYQQEGNTRKMINTGYHNDKVWRSIIFQLMVALYVLHLNKIYIKDFSIENNVFIKDLSVEGAATSYWRYKINGVDYFIPNYGYIVLVDSNYKNMNEPENSKTHKLDGKIFDANNTIRGEEDKKTLEMFKTALDTNNFDTNFTNEGGVKPDGVILNMLDNIKSHPSLDINDYFINFMTKFMNNRIGTYLKEQEIVHIRKDDLREFKKGQILAYEESTNTYKFVLYLDVTDGVAKVLTKDKTAQTDPNINKEDEEIVEKTIQVTTLFNYSLTEPIVQNANVNETNPTEENILETYTININ
jgi:hypothetical protein